MSYLYYSIVKLMLLTRYSPSTAVLNYNANVLLTFIVMSCSVTYFYDEFVFLTFTLSNY